MNGPPQPGPSNTSLALSPAHIVATTNGELRGCPAPSEAGVLSFLGIPYASPPIGDLRFAPPQPHPGWAGVRDAVEFGAQAAQGPSTMDAVMGTSPKPGVEDCLFLNVWTPSLTGNRPVMVWIHGGAFLTGTGSMPWYDGTNLAAIGNTVVVTINYRLGAFGFLALPAVPGSGVAGCLDQIAALQWVRDNIAAFGGDPNRVTVFGESAGAISIGALLGMPSADGLFHQAIMQSGACRHLGSADSSSSVRDAFLGHLGVAADAPVEELRALTAEEILSGSARFLGAATHGMMPFVPTVDEHFLFDSLSRLDGMHGSRPTVRRLIVGTNLDECRLYTAFDPKVAALNRDGVISRVARLGVDDPVHLVDSIAEKRPELSWGEVWSAICTDDVFRIPAQLLCETASTAGIDVHNYLFAWATEALGGRMGSCHALEIPFALGNLDKPGISLFVGEAENVRALSNAMASAWTAFAHGQSPWSRYDSVSRLTQVFGATPATADATDAVHIATTEADLFASDRALWGATWARRRDAADSSL
jgi:para-nitrobenzyl esterase